MQNRLTELFERKSSQIFSVFITAGFPHLNSTVEIIEELAHAGVDMIEIGIPFSDPMADGPVIQHSSTVALKNGINLHLILKQIEQAREKVKTVPFILMGYINPILQYGIKEFFQDAKEAGADALIVPDLPFNIYLKDFRKLSAAYDLPVIMLITPETSVERIRLIDENCDGFIYMVSSASTTGVKDRFNEEQLAYFDRIQTMSTNHPRLIGFGISNPTTIQAAFDYSSGAIVGSLFIKLLQSEPTVYQAVKALFERLGVKG